VSQATISQQVRALAELGLNVRAMNDEGYQLGHALELLSTGSIRRQLDPNADRQLESFDLFLDTDSTNERLLEMPPPVAGKTRVCMAEYQASGRGRMGRPWHAPFGSGVCLSVSRVFEKPGDTFSALGLAAGVAITKALAQCGVGDVMLKWPNDVIWRGGKLAGVLIEMRGEVGGPVKAVIGVGLNYALDLKARQAIAKSAALAPVDMCEISGGEPPGRNRLAAALIESLLDMLGEFEQHGLKPFVGNWREDDVLLNRPVVVSNGNRRLSGIARGIDETGALLVDVNGVPSRFVSGEASLSSTAELSSQ
jgi:BirA family biotin operon repressor/biotin-[acetyl-CoA-carboxylase] ligase